jgi:hypothetical protein
MLAAPVMTEATCVVAVGDLLGSFGIGLTFFKSSERAVSLGKVDYQWTIYYEVLLK